MRPGKRWDTDVRGVGVGSASAAAAGLRELLELSGRPDWVAEEPGVHLEGHLREAAERVGLTVTGTRTTDGGVFEVDVVHEPGMSKRAVRMAAWGVVAAVAEATTHVRESSAAGTTRFDVVTGMPDAPDGFAAHGHHLVLTVRPGIA